MKSLSLLLQLVCVCVMMCFHTTFSQERTHTFVNTYLSQPEAQAYCQHHHADLSSVLSPTDHLKLQSLNYTRSAWIGLSLGPQNWTWADGSSSTFYHWHQVNKRCAAVTTGGLWVNKFCSAKLPFICQSGPGQYITFSVPKTLEEARADCADQGFILATFKSASSRPDQWPDALHWMGLKKGTWVDEDSWGTLAVQNYSNWKTEQFCALMDSDGEWRDEVCFERHAFVCADHHLNYQLSSEPLSWQEAQQSCRDRNMHLVTIHNASHNSLFRSAFDGKLWIGLSNNPWRWADGSIAEVQYWGAKEPRGSQSGTGDCVMMEEGLWRDGPCSRRHPFFCLMRPQERLKVLTAPSSWEEALLHCRGLGGDLASIGDHGNQMLIQQVALAATTTHVWVGLRFLAGEWLWLSGGQLAYHHWAVGKGRDICPLHHCGAVESSTGFWEPRSCDEELDFLCQLP